MASAIRVNCRSQRWAGMLAYVKRWLPEDAARTCLDGLIRAASVQRYEA